MGKDKRKWGNHQISLVEFCVVGDFREEMNAEVGIIDAADIVV